MITSQVGEAYNVRDFDYGKNQQHGRSQTINNRGSDKSRSKSRKRLVECHYCHKKGYMKKDCYAVKNKEREKEKGKTHGDGHVMQVTSPSSSMNIEEINATCDDDVDILVMDDDATYVEVNNNGSLTCSYMVVELWCFISCDPTQRVVHTI